MGKVCNPTIFADVCWLSVYTTDHILTRLEILWINKNVFTNAYCLSICQSVKNGLIFHQIGPGARVCLGRRSGSSQNRYWREECLESEKYLLVNIRLWSTGLLVRLEKSILIPSSFPFQNVVFTNWLRNALWYLLSTSAFLNWIRHVRWSFLTRNLGPIYHLLNTYT